MTVRLDAAMREMVRANRFRNAHDLLFAHRHEYPFAPFHRQLVEDFWSDSWNFIDLGFRECGKTTIAEEAIAVAALDGVFRNCLIIGAKEELAAELLTNIKSEIENNEGLIGIWGDQIGDTWTNTKITLKNGHCIQARGVGQTMRGTKHRDWRPDLVIVNDFEDDEELLTPEGRRRTLRWFLKVLLPACDRRRRKIRIYDTVRDAESVPMMLIKKQQWPHRLIPISYLDEAGAAQSSWPQHPTLTTEWIEKERGIYASLGELDIWEREYMMEAATQADRDFTPPMFKIEPRARTWEAVYAAIDPARTVRRTSATTGWAVWSWVGGRLIVWEAGAKRLLPDEIVDLAFRIAHDYRPVEIAIEEDGLNEWLLQPIRHRISRDGAIPVRGQRAPRGKFDFIRGLQPFFSAGECLFAADLPELREQLLAFPTGKIDAANALAYALLVRPGRLIYEQFNPARHLVDAGPDGQKSCYLAANATTNLTTGVLVQLAASRTLALADWVAEGDPGDVLEGIVRDASMAAAGRLVLVAARQHFDQYANKGLVQAARSLGLEVRAAGDPLRGREFIRRELLKQLGAGPAFGVAPAARWTLNALAGGYSTPMVGGRLGLEASPNQYRVLMEGFEAMAGLLAWGLEDEDDDAAQNFAYDSAGRRYRSAMPARMNQRSLM